MRLSHHEVHPVSRTNGTADNIRWHLGRFSGECVLWGATSYRLVDRHRRFEGTCFVHIQGEGKKLYSAQNVVIQYSTRRRVPEYRCCHLSGFLLWPLMFVLWHLAHGWGPVCLNVYALCRDWHWTFCANRNFRLGENGVSKVEIICFLIRHEVANTDIWELHTYIGISGQTSFSKF